MLGLHEPAKPSHEIRSQPSLRARTLVALAAALVLLLRCIRPPDTAYSLLSQTVIVTPFEKPAVHKQTPSVDLPGLGGDYS